jgi:hypothetical protein
LSALLFWRSSLFLGGTRGRRRRRRRRRGDGRHLFQRAVASKNKGSILRSPNAGTQIFAVL